KYGTQERVHNGREFTDLNEQLLSSLLNQHTQLSIVKHWQSVDQRPGRESEVWLNALIKYAIGKG
ncbi:MAG: SAM-dependent methyltransferase, partial [Pseudoalteromonas sp.]